MAFQNRWDKNAIWADCAPHQTILTQGQNNQEPEIAMHFYTRRNIDFTTLHRIKKANYMGLIMNSSFA